jgi:hypothetical protein
MAFDRALTADLTVYDVLRRAFGLSTVSAATVMALAPFSRDDFARISEELGTYLHDTAPAYAGDADCIAGHAQHEIWAAFDVDVTVQTITARQGGLAAEDYEEAAERILHGVKRALLFAHRIVILDYLTQTIDALLEHGSPESVSLDRPEALAARATFLCALYGTLGPLLQTEVVLIAREGLTRDQRISHDDLIRPIRSDIKALAATVARSFAESYPTNRLVKAANNFGGGPIVTGHIGGSGKMNLKDQRDLQLLAYMLVLGISQMRRYQLRLDPCFDDLDVARVYSHALHLIDSQRDKYALTRPLIFAELSTNTGIHAERLLLQEATDIRRDEEFSPTGAPSSATRSAASSRPRRMATRAPDCCARSFASARRNGGPDFRGCSRRTSFSAISPTHDSRSSRAFVQACFEAS